MDLPWPVLIGIVLASGLAGFVDAIAGGGGLIQLPPMIAALGVQWAPGANKISSISGTTAAAIRYAVNGSVRWPVVAVAGPLAFAGSLAGSLSYLRIVKEAAHVIRPVFAVCFLLLAAHQAVRALRRGPPAREPVRRPVVGALFVLGIGAYDGFVGPGTGMFLFWTLTTWFSLAVLDATGTTKAINWVSNAGAVTAFVASGAVPWPVALSAAAANTTGGWLGAHTAIRQGVRFIRLVTAVVCAGASVYLLVT